ncbi:MAG TPA: CAP domain-containing protein [Acidimicrobiales bacterium]|nr:CAP domain-containing protein [Acidimicrobiales bacterium]
MALVATVLALLTSACLSTGQTTVLNEMNADRSSNRLRTLPTHPELDAKAQAWAEKLARDNRLSHSRVQSGAPSCWRSLGENVGYGRSVSSIEDAYMASAGHRANILDSRWDYVGVGHATRGGRVFTVQVFMQGCR